MSNIIDVINSLCRHKQLKTSDLSLHLHISDLRNAVSTWLQQPTIVEVHHSVAKVSQSVVPADEYTESSDMTCPIDNWASTDRNSMIAGIVFICPTKLDRQILLDSGVIHLPRGNTITMEVNVEETSQRSSDLRRLDENQCLKLLQLTHETSCFKYQINGSARQLSDRESIKSENSWRLSYGSLSKSADT